MRVDDFIADVRARLEQDRISFYVRSVDKKSGALPQRGSPRSVEIMLLRCVPRLECVARKHALKHDFRTTCNFSSRL